MRASKHVLALMLALVWPALGSAAETMRAISFIPKNDPVLAMANAWVAEVNAKLGSQLRINYVGGPEVIGRFQQVEALRTGVIDVIFVPSGDYQDQMPAAQTFVLSKLTPSEERKSGFYEFMVEEHAKKDQCPLPRSRADLALLSVDQEGAEIDRRSAWAEDALRASSTTSSCASSEWCRLRSTRPKCTRR